jgi:hypothetical protein
MMTAVRGAGRDGVLRVDAYGGDVKVFWGFGGGVKGEEFARIVMCVLCYLPGVM